MAKRSSRLACPNCKKKLKADQPMQAGVSVRCPSCGTRFALPTDLEISEKGIIAPQLLPQRVENETLVARTAVSPLVYAMLGAVVVAMLGGASFVAFSLGRGQAVADVNVSQAAGDSNEGIAATNQPAAGGQQPGNPAGGAPVQGNASNGVEDSAPGTSVDDSENDSPSVIATGTRPRDPTPNGIDSQPPRDPADSTPLGEGNRPQKDPIELLQPVAAGVGGSIATFAPIFIEVPVLVPASVLSPVVPSAAPNATPDLNVVIAFQNLSLSMLKVDHQSKPGLTAGLVISLDQTPKTEVKIKVTADAGLVVDLAELTFAPNVVPIKQLVTISGDGKAKLPRGPSKLLYVNIEATGGGLKATSPAKIPMQLLRRNSFQTANGLAIQRSDAAFPNSTSPVLSNWTIRVPGAVAPTLVSEAYEPDYVQLTWGAQPISRLRIYEDQIQVETPTGSGVYRTQISGSWQ